jgi:MraZ protein
LSFTGTFRHTIDAKGRLIIPSRLRDEIKDGGVVLTRWAEGCIALWSREHWDKLVGALLGQPHGDANARRIKRQLGAWAHSESVDRQGRIGIPAELASYAGLERDTVIIGAIDHAEIWEPEAYGRLEQQAPGSFDEVLEGLPI